MKDRANVVIIGAGIVGCSVAYHLTRLGMRDIVVLEQGPLFATGGSTSHAPGGIFTVNFSQTLIRFADYTVDLISGLQVDGLPAYYNVGSMEAAWTPERLEDLKRKAGAARSWGVEADLISPADAREKIPLLSERIHGALFVPSDGIASPVRAAEAMARVAADAGAEFHGDTAVTSIELTDGRVKA